jgi:putative flippase GtrA
MFLRFCLVGTLGFLVDAGVLLLLTAAGFAGARTGRVASFLVAACVTWLLNRRFTFRSGASAKSLGPYVLLTGFGALLNVGVYWLWITAFGETPGMLVLGVAAGSIVALAFNFLVSKHVVFRAPRAASGAPPAPRGNAPRTRARRS